MSDISSLLREPMTHFFVVGLVLFAIYHIRSSEAESVEGEIPSPVTIAFSQIDHLELTWEQLWNRKPTTQELELLVNDHIREELLYREALALGLDQDDTVVRRRMAQKMAFLSKSGGVNNVSDEVLRNWFEERKNRYELAPVISFYQLFFSKEERSDQIEGDVSRAIKQLGDTEPANLKKLPGDKSMIRNSWSNMTASQLTPLFGEKFSTGVFDLDQGRWGGPIVSELGVHAVFVSEKTQRRIPDFEEIKSRVELDWMQDQTRSANMKLLNELIDKYGVEVTPDARERLGEMTVLGSGAAK